MRRNSQRVLSELLILISSRLLVISRWIKLLETARLTINIKHRINILNVCEMEIPCAVIFKVVAAHLKHPDSHGFVWRCL